MKLLRRHRYSSRRPMQCSGEGEGWKLSPALEDDTYQKTLSIYRSRCMEVRCLLIYENIQLIESFSSREFLCNDADLLLETSMFGVPELFAEGILRPVVNNSYAGRIQTSLAISDSQTNHICLGIRCYMSNRGMEKGRSRSQRGATEFESSARVQRC